MLVIVAGVALTSAMAQVLPSQQMRIDQNALRRAIERSDREIENERRATRGQTWFDRGEAFYNAAAAVAMYIHPGMSLERLKDVVGKDIETSEREVNGRNFTVVSVPEADIFLIDGVVQFWDEKIVIHEGATQLAAEAFSRAGELDNRLRTRATDGMDRVANIYKMRANAQHNLGNNAAAAENFLAAFQTQLNPLIGVVDGNSVFNAGYLFLMLEDYARSIEVFEEAVANDVWNDGNIAYFLSWAYLRTDNHPKAKEILQRGVERFPGNELVVEGLINYYALSKDDFSEIIDILRAAVERDPSRIVLWNGLGQAYLNKGDRTQTIEFFTRFAEKFPNDFGANYYLADQLMDEGEDILREADNNNSLSQAQRNELRARAMEVFRKGFPPSERAYNIAYNAPMDNASVHASLQRVARILFRLKDEPDMAPIFQKYNKLYEETLGIER